MNPTYDFTGQVAIVTGASSGMGLVTAQAFAQTGASVVLADINQTALTAATDSLAAAGHQVLGVPCDVADETSVAATVQTAVDTFGRLDLAFNNAGIQAPPTDAADEPAELFDRVNAINLLPLPVGLGDRVTRYRAFSAAWSLGKWPRARTAASTVLTENGAVVTSDAVPQGSSGLVIRRLATSHTPGLLCASF